MISFPLTFLGVTSFGAHCGVNEFVEKVLEDFFNGGFALISADFLGGIYRINGIYGMGLVVTRRG